MTTRFLTGSGIWEALRDGAATSKARCAAIAYLTSADALPWAAGDVLVVDASDEAIAAGATAAAALRALYEAQVSIHSLADLHAKVYVFGDEVFSGSANLSSSAQGPQRVEAGVLSRDPQVVRDARSFVLDLRNISVTVDSAFLDRIDRIAVRSRMKPSNKEAGEGTDHGCLWRLQTAPNPIQSLMAYTNALMQAQLGDELVAGRKFRLWSGTRGRNTFATHLNARRLEWHEGHSGYDDVFSITEGIGLTYFRERSVDENLRVKFLKAIETGDRRFLPESFTDQEMERFEKLS
ncbi:phospholipase D-like domain-containing protein [Cupriavidus taiwanensis]|uniref:phospholipase D-like domain-containing protein n=1 Tax=Cupriavidus taiwanensis TaxID=164546 RepID=UPI0018DB0EA3|nr:phospholipase D-like domain-containing protein [Cupriavidus taiwanensis]